jgi:hypothetical protein
MQNTGQILRSRKNGKSKYTAINNDILQSKTLTAQEKSILVHLLSLPEDWIVYKGLIWKDMNMGREQFNKHWKGLIDKGYIISIRMIDKDSNLVVGWNHVVYEEPVISDDRTNQDSDLLDFGQSENPYLNKVITEQSTELTKETLKESNNPTKGEGFISIDGNEIAYEDAFSQVWKAYNYSSSRQAGSKAKALAKWMKLSNDDILAIRTHLPKFIKSHVDAKKTEFFPDFVTYLNGRRFEDEKLPYPSASNKLEDYLNQMQGL